MPHQTKSPQNFKFLFHDVRKWKKVQNNDQNKSNQSCKRPTSSGPNPARKYKPNSARNRK